MRFTCLPFHMCTDTEGINDAGSAEHLPLKYRQKHFCRTLFFKYVYFMIAERYGSGIH